MLPNQNYTVSVQNLPDYFTLSPATAQATFDEGTTEQQLEFCLSATQQVNDLNVRLLPINESRPGFASNYQLVVQNMGTATTAAQVTIQYDSQFQTYASANPEPSTTGSNLLTFAIPEIHPFELQYVNVTFQNAAPPVLIGGEALTLTASISPDVNDATPLDNSFNLVQPVVNSYDPNDKQVLQGSQVHIDQAGEYLDYIIRFQNTGSASAVNVRIADALHANLDWNTFSPVSSSHNYRLAITENNQVSFIFDNINLPHESENEAASHGFVAYKIKPVQTVEVGDVVSGNASIFFDYNAPIITNSASTTFVESLGVAESGVFESLSIYPNPAKDILRIQADASIHISE
ncbi:MAG: hypothetical protein EOP49_50800, partial [Sphingobacteriales bacterium]